MSQGNTKEFTMAVGTSVLDATIIEGDGFFTSMETVGEPEPASQTEWSGVKNSNGQLCRICANTNDYLIPIYEGEGAEHQLETKIQKHLPIEVSAADSLPLQLCYQCASTLIAWDTLITNCLEADKKLRAMQEIAEDDEDDAKNTELLEEPPPSDTADSDDEPLISSKLKMTDTSKSKAPLKKKILSKAKTKSPIVKSTKPSTVTKETEEKERTVDRQLMVNNVLDLTELLGVDGVTATNNKPRKQKKKSNKKAVELDQFTVELTDINTIIQEAKVIKTSKSFIEMTTRPYPYCECPICQTVVAKEKLSQHLTEEHGLVTKQDDSETVSCEMCGKTFCKKSFLQRHIKSVHEKIIRAKCNVCGKLFTDLSNHKQHMLIHAGVKSYTCQICGKGFVQAQGLRMHMPAHSDDHPYKCIVCGKRFRRKQHHELHLMKHNGLRPHQCETCGKSFTSKNELKMHSWIHKNEWPYTCDICGKGFNQSYGLKLHVKNHHTLVVF